MPRGPRSGVRWPATHSERRSAEATLGELEWLWREGHRRWIPYAVVYELAKVAGLQIGIRHRYLPESVRRILAGEPEPASRE